MVRVAMVVWVAGQRGRVTSEEQRRNQKSTDGGSSQMQGRGEEARALLPFRRVASHSNRHDTTRSSLLRAQIPCTRHDKTQSVKGRMNDSFSLVIDGSLRTHNNFGSPCAHFPSPLHGSSYTFDLHHITSRARRDRTGARHPKHLQHLHRTPWQ